MIQADCLKCLDAGVVEVRDGAFKTLALCYCRQGRKQGWELERIPIVGFSSEPLDWREYKSNRIGTSDFVEKIAWHKERIKMAEKFWADTFAASADKKGEM